MNKRQKQSLIKSLQHLAILSLLLILFNVFINFGERYCDSNKDCDSKTTIINCVDSAGNKIIGSECIEETRNYSLSYIFYATFGFFIIILIIIDFVIMMRYTMLIFNGDGK